MELLKRSILLENSIDRTTIDGYGKLTATTFNLPIFLTQSFDDIGIYTDMDYIGTIPLNTPPSDIYLDYRPTGVTVDMYYDQERVITGTTDDSNLIIVRAYQDNDWYVPGLNMSYDIYTRFDGVISENQTLGIVNYVIGGDVDSVGNYIPDTGVKFTTYLDDYVTYTDPVTGVVSNSDVQRTTFEFKTKGRNEFNTSLSAITKEEIFLGIVFPQEVQSDVFIERGGEDIFEKHMVMGEIKTVDDIDGYRNGYLVNSNI